MINKEDFLSSLNDLEKLYAMTYEEVKNMYGPETAKMVGFDQRNPHHCYDLWNHTLHVLEGLGDDADPLLKTAAFFHDIGKTAVAKEKDGRLVFYGHAAVSAKIAQPILEKYGFSEDEITTVVFFIRHHDDFISWILPEEESRHSSQVHINQKNINKYLDKTLDKIPDKTPEKTPDKTPDKTLDKTPDKTPDKALDKTLDIKAGFPTIGTIRQLLKLCKADINGQAEKVYMKGVLIDSKAHKLKKLELIESIVNAVGERA